ncbi:hypothetical protein L873DRAFT_1668581 [Choiromyces venosus 120613-1]|uniref:Rhodanese domain-containing protein n=1 Tax=Choiromyces venosus 120613-1 TaxID=1336337 RepID=A0A3N4KCQ3_9PEZI|nr:hypothetical protein L873DRAFT_1668581 [Choiromyces venosus 120613-1]
MSGVTISTLNRISRERLSSLLLTQPSEEKVVVVDVRDSGMSSPPPQSPPSLLMDRRVDHIGGHIKSSRHVPSGSLDYTAAELARQLKDMEKVVFHCALSQQRGPSAALKYLRERERLFGKESTVATGGVNGEEEVIVEGEGGGAKKQEVLVLDGGFVEWQARYGNDKRLTENYNKELWEAGY